MRDHESSILSITTTRRMAHLVMGLVLHAGRAEFDSLVLYQLLASSMAEHGRLYQ